MNINIPFILWIILRVVGGAMPMAPFLFLLYRWLVCWKMPYWWRHLTKRCRYFKSSRYRHECLLAQVYLARFFKFKRCKSKQGSGGAADKVSTQQMVAYPAAQVRSASGDELTALLPFDTDAFIIGVDNHATRCMDSNKKHFTNLVRTQCRIVKGIAAGLQITALGTIH